jgi:hypothetical protein
MPPATPSASPSAAPFSASFHASHSTISCAVRRQWRLHHSLRHRRLSRLLQHYQLRRRSHPLVRRLLHYPLYHSPHRQRHICRLLRCPPTSAVTSSTAPQRHHLLCHWLRLLLHRWSCHQRHHRRAISGTVCCTSHAPPLSTIQHLRLRQWLQAIGGTSIMRRLQHHQQHYTPSVALFTYISGTISARFDVCTRSHTWLDNLRWQPYRQFYIDARHRWALYPVTGLNHCYSSYIIRPTVRQLYHHLPTAMSPATLPIISLAALLAMLQRPQLHHRSRRHSCPQPSVTCAV